MNHLRIMEFSVATSFILLSHQYHSKQVEEKGLAQSVLFEMRKQKSEHILSNKEFESLWKLIFGFLDIAITQEKKEEYKQNILMNFMGVVSCNRITTLMMSCVLKSRNYYIHGLLTARNRITTTFTKLQIIDLHQNVLSTFFPLYMSKCWLWYQAANLSILIIFTH